MTNGNFDTEKVSVTFSRAFFHFSRKLQSGNDLINAWFPRQVVWGPVTLRLGYLSHSDSDWGREIGRDRMSCFYTGLFTIKSPALFFPPHAPPLSSPPPSFLHPSHSLRRGVLVYGGCHPQGPAGLTFQPRDHEMWQDVTFHFPLFIISGIVLQHGFNAAERRDSPRCISSPGAIGGIKTTLSHAVQRSMKSAYTYTR